MAHVNPVQIQKFLKGVDYPANKSALLENAKTMGADENVCESLEQLPDEDFQTPADVSQALGQLDDTGGQSQSTQSQFASSTGGNEFLAQAVQDSLAEIELSELALQKTGNDDIKMFAQRMIDDHGQMGREIEHCAENKNAGLPKDLTPEHKSLIDQMSKLSGQDFDRKFIDHNVKDHEKDVKVFKHYADQESDGDIRALAEKGVKILSEHLDMARAIQQRLGAGT